VGLSKEEKEQLEKLTAKANEPDEEDFEIEIGSGDRYARVPYSRGRSYLQQHFGIDLDPNTGEDSADEDTATEGENGKGKKPAKPATDEGTKRTGHWSARMDQHQHRTA
jgi:hypothetical protein